MKGGAVIREARRRAGLSQEELARRLDTKQPVIARWETGKRAPDFDTVVRAVRSCDLELAISIKKLDTSDDLAIAKALAISPAQRLRKNQELLQTEAWARTARRAKS